MTPGKSRHISASSPTTCLFSLLLLLLLVLLLLFLPLLLQALPQEPPSDTKIPLRKSQNCARNSVKNPQTSAPRRNLCPKPRENRWKQADRRVLARGRQGCPALCTRASPPRCGLTERPGRKGLVSFGVTNHHHGISNTQFICAKLLGCTRGIKAQGNRS